MSCPYHRHCAFPDWRPDICEYCHAPWETITAPATRVDRDGVKHLFGYGEMPAGHLWGHAANAAREAAKTRRRVA